MKPKREHPLLVILSAPSGAGKTTLCGRLLAVRKDMVRAVTCTTRRPRGAEVDGKDYHFLSDSEFDRLLGEGRFLEHAVVHGHKYGTLKKDVADAMADGKSVALVIDVQGARQVRKFARGLPKSDPIRRGFVDIFVAPPSMAVLTSRLRGRGEDTEQAMAERLRNASVEMKSASEYSHVVVNERVDKTCGEVVEILARR